MIQVNKCFPEKQIQVTSDDSPWCTDKVKNLKRTKCREYNKHRKSSKWLELKDKYDTLLKVE